MCVQTQHYIHISDAVCCHDSANFYPVFVMLMFPLILQQCHMRYAVADILMSQLNNFNQPIFYLMKANHSCTKLLQQLIILIMDKVIAYLRFQNRMHVQDPFPQIRSYSVILLYLYLERSHVPISKHGYIQQEVKYHTHTTSC